MPRASWLSSCLCLNDSVGTKFETMRAVTTNTNPDTMRVNLDSCAAPFAQHQALEIGAASECAEKRCPESLPGHPRISRNDDQAIAKFLEKEFCSHTMERMSKFLWMMSFQSHANISALHRQRIKGRTIVITEDPKLHLVWYHDRVFIKPLPLYLWSFDFWTQVFSTEATKQDPRRSKIRAAALGYLRTWFYLIQHESDFRIAQAPEVQLVPESMTWDAFCRFSAHFDQIIDAHVSERYRFGEIRLTRLNFYSKLLLQQWSFQRMNHQYGEYFAQFYGPLLFIFAVISVTLNAMQVVMSVEQVSSANWRFFWSISRWSGVLCAIVSTVLTLGLMGLLIIKICTEWRVALRDRWRRVRTHGQGRDVEQ